MDFNFNEDQLPQKQRLPRALKVYGREDSEWRGNCPINGTRLFDKPKPLTPEAKSTYSNRKVREARKAVRKRELGREIQGDGAGGNMTKRRRMSSSLSGTSIPSIVHSPTLAPQGAFHMWSTNDPLAPTVLIVQQPPPTHASTASIHLSHPPTTPAEQSRYTINETSGAMANARPAHSSSTTLDLKTNNGLPSANHPTSPSPMRCPGSPATSAASPSSFDASVLGPALLAEQNKGWLTDEFIATYQSFFVSRSSSSRHLDQALAPELGQYYADTPHQAVSEPVPLVCSPATIHNTGTISTIACNGIRRQGPLDMNQGSITTYTDQPNSEELLASSTSPVDVAQIDVEMCDMVGTTTDFGYALNYANNIYNPPAAIPSNIHPRPSKLSSYSELAPASNFPASAFVDHHIQPPMDAAVATFHTATPSVFTNAPLYVHRSADVLGTYSQDPVYLTQPYAVQEVTVHEGEYAHALDGGFEDVINPFPADIIKLSLPSVDLATVQVLAAISKVNNYTRIQDGIARSHRLLLETESPLGLRMVWRQQRHDAPTNSF